MATAVSAPRIELPILQTTSRLLTRGQSRPLKRFVVFGSTNRFLVAMKGHRWERSAQRHARRLRRWGICALATVVDQADVTAPIYADDAMYLEDYRELYLEGYGY